METTEMLQLLNTGIGGVTLFILYNLWGEFKAQNAFIRQMLMRQLDADIDRSSIKKELKKVTESHNIQT